MFKTQYNFNSKAEQNFEKIKGHSLTVPDMSYTIKELLTEFTTIPEITRAAQYDDDPNIDYPHPWDVDLVDLQENLEVINEKRTNLLEEIDKQKRLQEAKSAEVKEADSPAE